jgi:peroxin-19
MSERPPGKEEGDKGAPPREAGLASAGEVEAVPDPDEDDLDDLDDMLNDFSAVKVQPQKPTEVAASVRSVQVEEETAEVPLADDDFAKQLQAGMAELLGELDSSVGPLLAISDDPSGGSD